MTTRRLVILSGALLLSAHLSTANALQLVDPVEGQNSFVKISAKELTRVAVENGKIRSIIVSDGEVAIERDEERGQVFLRPLVLNKPINARFITSSGRTYSIVMQAVDIPQEDVIIRDVALRGSDRAQSKEERSGAGGHQRALKNLITAMAAEEPPTNIEVKQLNQEVALWDNTRFILVAVYSDRSLVGERYQLSNTGTDRIRVVEQELYRRGVLAVAIENMTLDPGQSTSIYIVRRN
jgi:conjugal transfer pilus assembly protein TraK